MASQGVVGGGAVNTESRQLRTQVSYRFGVPLLYLSGELDRHSHDDLRALIEQELASRPSGLLLECSELAFIDSGGLSLLFETLKSLEDRRWLGIVSPNVGVLKLIEMTGLTDRPGVRVYSDLAAVKKALSGSGAQPS